MIGLWEINAKKLPCGDAKNLCKKINRGKVDDYANRDGLGVCWTLFFPLDSREEA